MAPLVVKLVEQRVELGPHPFHCDVLDRLEVAIDLLLGPPLGAKRLYFVKKGVLYALFGGRAEKGIKL